MPRAARAVIPGCAHHVTQRGNNRQDVFFVDDDRRGKKDGGGKGDRLLFPLASGTALADLASCHGQDEAKPAGSAATC